MPPTPLAVLGEEKYFNFFFLYQSLELLDPDLVIIDGFVFRR